MTGWLIVGCAAVLVGRSAAKAEGSTEGVTAVSSRVSKDYVRTKLQDGSFRQEEYAFGNGGRFDGPFRDETINKMGFLDIARIIAATLAAQNYVPAKDISTEKLLIMFHWGTTHVSDAASDTPGDLSYKSAQDIASEHGPASPAARAALGLAEMQLAGEALARNHIDVVNARMLGYDSEGLIGTYYGSTIGNTGMLAAHREDLINEIEETRYFVVMIAYDFQMFLKEKKLQALWETRFSINEPRNDFSKALPAMALYASKYFGQDSHGLLRKKVLEGQVSVGEPKSLDEFDTPRK
jgi:hypothetical protein